MKVNRSVYPLALATLALAACAGEPAPAPSTPGARLDLHVGALSLPGVGRVCYDVRVENEATATVWERGAVGQSAAEGDATTICSDAYGDGAGGGVAYVGTCDASSPEHTVRLWIDSIEDENGAPLTDWRDPCPAGTEGDPGGCTKPAHCDPNADTPVAFDLTVMRAANQGFFDVAVEFDDIFCSAKLDCFYDDAGTEPIQLLFRDGVRSQTAVIGFACTGGAGGAGTVLHASDVKVVCGDGGVGTPVGAVAAGFGTFTLGDGSMVGMEYRLLADNSGGIVLPTYWERTAPSTWANGSWLPTGAHPMGWVMWPAGTDGSGNERVAGLVFDTIPAFSNPELALWTHENGAWSLTATTPYLQPPATGEPFARLDAATNRFWLGDPRQGPSPQDVTPPQVTEENVEYVGYWDLADPGAGIALVGQLVGEGCAVHDVEGDAAIGACDTGAFYLDVATGVSTPLPAPGAPWTFTRGVALNDRVLLGSYGIPNDSSEQYVLWQRVGDGAWTSGAITPTALQFTDRQWAAAGYAVLDGRVLYHGGADGALESWSTASIDGVDATAFEVYGVVVGYGATPVVFGGAGTGGAGGPIVGLLPAPGERIAFVSLSAPPVSAGDIRLRLGVGVDGAGNLWLAASGYYGFFININADENTVIWAVNVAEGTLTEVAQTMLTTSGERSIKDFNNGLRYPLRDVTALGGIDLSTSQPLTWEPFAAATVAPTTPPSLPEGVTNGSGSTTRLDPTIAGNGWSTDPDPDDGVWGYAVYRGAEQLTCGGASCDKLYWNVALGIDPALGDCSVHFEGTAADAPGLTGGTIAADAHYPYIVVDAPLTGAGSVVCRKDGLDDGSGRVASTYTDGAAHLFCYAFDGADTATAALCGGD
ncbi:MAG: hypothetical protein KC635_12370 [Myxococcales bacterium]|nr:hypothetical protein [Myxococcales bacterium]MCB9737439.1 hypothetical protein [Deltaproteobacteria bacterium]